MHKLLIQERKKKAPSAKTFVASQVEMRQNSFRALGGEPKTMKEAPSREFLGNFLGQFFRLSKCGVDFSKGLTYLFSWWALHEEQRAFARLAIMENQKG